MQEYRPVEEDEIDLIELAQTFWSERILIAKITGAFLVLGLLLALFIPTNYSTEATLMPETQSSQGMAGSLLQQYGGMLGMSASGLQSGKKGTISPQLYPNVVESLPFQVELMNTPVRFAGYDTTATPHQFFTEIYSPSVLGYVKQFTIGLPGQIIGLFKSEEKKNSPLVTKVNRDSVLSLSQEQMKTVKTMKNRLTVSVSQGVITVNSEFPDPRAAAEIGQEGIKLLKEYMRQYRTQKAKEDLQFVKEQVTEARKNFEQAQQNLAEFEDSNLNLATSKAQTKQQELQSQYDLTNNLYSSLKQRLQQSRMQLQEQTPVFSVLQPVSVPLNDNTSGLLILVISGILGGIIGLGWVLIKNWWKHERVRFE